MAEKSEGRNPMNDLVVFLGILLLLGIIWLFTGGLERLRQGEGPFLRPPSPLGTGDTYYLSGADRWKFGTGGFGVRNTVSAGSTRTSPKEAERDLANIQESVDDLSEDIQAAIEFGTPSPYRGQITFERNTRGAKMASNKTEYLTLRANTKNSGGVAITGWKVVSSLANNDGTLREAYIPNGSNVPETGEVNPVYGITLSPGEKAHVVTGPSPIGVSFRVNICSGYLEQFQDYVPALERTCPKPEDELKFRQQYIPYENACEWYVDDLPRCEIVLKQTPKEYGTECDQFVKNELTYNSCVENHRYRPNFFAKEWRIYLNKQNELWMNKRDIIKLLDAEGKTVDLLSY